jgi:hypothetical protein
MISTVTATSATTITIAAPVTYAGVTGNSMSVDILRYKSTAFIDKTASNVLKYINNSDAVYSRYNTIQTKIVFVSNQSNVVPFVDQLEVIGVSA